MKHQPPTRKHHPPITTKHVDSFMFDTLEGLTSTNNKEPNHQNNTSSTGPNHGQPLPPQINILGTPIVNPNESKQDKSQESLG